MLQTGARAPDFELADLTGQTHKLQDMLARGPALVAFVKGDCRACQTAFPYLEKLWQTYKDRPWSFLILAQDLPTSAKQMAEKWGLTVPIATEHGHYPVSRAYDPEATPTYFWIEPDGKITKTALGFTKKDINELAALAAGQSDEDTPDIAPADDGQPAFRPG